MTPEQRHRCEYCKQFISEETCKLYQPYGTALDTEPPEPIHLCSECYASMMGIIGDDDDT